MLAFERSRYTGEGGLLPVAAGFAVAKDLVPANEPVSVEVERLTLRCGSEDQSRVAVRSPGDRYGAIR